MLVSLFEDIYYDLTRDSCVSKSVVAVKYEPNIDRLNYQFSDDNSGECVKLCKNALELLYEVNVLCAIYFIVTTFIPSCRSSFVS